MPRIFPIYLFTGNDAYLKREAVRKLKKALLGGNGSGAFNFNAYDIEKCPVKEVIDTLRSAPFASEKRLVLLERVEAAPEAAQKAILRYIENPSKSSCLVMQSSSEKFSGSFYREIVRCARELSFTLPEGGRLISWIEKEVRAEGKSIRRDAALLLKELKDGDAGALRCEINKLVTYIGARRVISLEDVEGLVGKSALRNVFEFVDVLSKKDAKKALVIAGDLLSAKKPIPEIFGMIGWHLRRIKKAKALLENGASSRKTGERCNVPRFYMERFIKEIKSFKAGEIDRDIDYLLEADYGIKKGHLKPRDALELFIVRVCGGA